MYEQAQEADHWNGRTFLHWAADQRQEELLLDLLPGIPHASLLLQDMRGQTPLMVAMRRSRAPSKAKVVEILWKATGEEGRRVKDKKGRTALHWMVLQMRGLKQATALCALLSTVSAEEVMERDIQGNTVLHCAAMMKANAEEGLHACQLVVEALHRLLPSQAYLTTNDNGLTALQTAAVAKNHIAVRALQQMVARHELLELDDKGDSFLLGLLKADTKHGVWLIAPSLPTEVGERMSEREIEECWRGNGDWGSLRGLSVWHAGALDVLVTRTPDEVLRSCVWLGTCVCDALDRHMFATALQLLERVDRAKTDDSASDFCGLCFEAVAKHLRRPFSSFHAEADAEIGRRILDLIPDYCCHELLLASCENWESNTWFFDEVLDRCRVLMVPRPTLAKLPHIATARKLAKAMAAFGPENKFAGMLFPIVSGYSASFLDELLDWFPREELLEKDCNGDSLLHYYLGQRQIWRRVPVMKVVVTKFPELRSMRNAAGETAQDLAASDEEREILAPIVKNAV